MIANAATFEQIKSSAVRQGDWAAWFNKHADEYNPYSTWTTCTAPTGKCITFTSLANAVNA